LPDVNFQAAGLNCQIDPIKARDDRQRRALELNDAGTGLNSQSATKKFSRELSAQISTRPVNRNSEHGVNNRL
jgi:hypothetical protein